MAQAMDWAAVRAARPATATQVFLNAGSRGLISTAAHAAGVASLDEDLAMPRSTPSADAVQMRARQLFSRLIGAATDEIAITKNVSEGLNAIATAVDWRAGDNVVVCTDLEHANNVYLWHRLSQRGVELRDVPSVGGVIDPGAMAAAMDHRTRLVAVSLVTFVPGFRTDVAAIAHAAHRVGALVLVDAVQACGVLAIDVDALGIDALATSTSKGLCGVRGLGFLYVRRSRTDALTPVHVARNSYDAGGKHYSEFEGLDAALKADARRFEYGNYNYVGLAVVTAAMAELLALGVPAIEARAVGLADALVAGLAAQGWPVLRPPAGLASTHLVTLGQRGPGGPTSTGNAALDRFAAELDAAGVRLAIRRGLLRFGFHCYNDESDVDAVLTIGAHARRVAA